MTRPDAHDWMLGSMHTSSPAWLQSRKGALHATPCAHRSLAVCSALVRSHPRESRQGRAAFWNGTLTDPPGQTHERCSGETQPTALAASIEQARTQASIVLGLGVSECCERSE